MHPGLMNGTSTDETAGPTVATSHGRRREGRGGLRPTVSVVLPTFNRADIVMQAIGSVLQQTFSDLELIIVDDSSTDATWSKLSRITDPRVRLVANTGAKGGAGARNHGVGLARAEWICQIDSDDLWSPDMLEHLVAGIERASPAVGVVYGSDHWIEFETGAVRRRRRAELAGYAYKRVFERDFYHHCAAAIRRTAFESVGGYDVSLEGVEDTDLQHRLTEEWEVLPVPEAVYLYRIGRDDQVTKAHATRARQQLKFLAKHEGVLRTMPASLVKIVGVIMVSCLEGAQWLDAARLYLRLLRWGPAAPRLVYRYSLRGAVVLRHHVVAWFSRRGRKRAEPVATRGPLALRPDSNR